MHDLSHPRPVPGTPVLPAHPPAPADRSLVVDRISSLIGALEAVSLALHQTHEALIAGSAHAAPPPPVAAPFGAPAPAPVAHVGMPPLADALPSADGPLPSPLLAGTPIPPFHRRPAPPAPDAAPAIPSVAAPAPAAAVRPPAVPPVVPDRTPLAPFGLAAHVYDPVVGVPRTG